MKQLQGSSVLFAGAAVVLLAAQPVWAQASQVTAVRLNQTNSGFNVVLGTSTGARPQIITSKRGNTLIADIINTQLRLPQGNSFRRDNPAPGITSVVITQLDPNTTRMVVTGTTSAPNSQLAQPNAQGITLSISRASGTAALPRLTPSNPSVDAAPPQPVPTPAQPQTRPPLAAQKPNVLVPNPKVTIDGQPAPAAGTAQPTNPAPPMLQRAIAPPVGDIAISNSDASPSIIQLDTAERVPRLVLRDAPVREVLALLARAAGLNLAFSNSQAPAPGQQGQPQPQQDPTAATNEGPRISLDIEDESVTDVFNYVLRISGLQANRNGRTIFVSPRLTNQARDVIVRSFRLNQVTVGVALNFLVGMGAESAVSRERTITSVNAVPVGGATTPATQTQTSTETRIETQRIDFQDSVPLLRGLQVLGDERTNSVTLIGSPKQIDIATTQIIQLDSRRRQVAVNVKIIDVNLSATDLANSSFSFGISDTFIQNDRGNAIINFGTTNPPSERGRVGEFPPDFSKRFLSRLQATVTNGNGKILTDPTLTVQEGQTAVVNLTQDVFGGFELETQAVGTSNVTTQVREPIIKQAGLILQIRVDRIDDNGFVALSVAPAVSAIGGTQPTADGDIALLSSRQLSSGQIRLRDGQTLILSGIIQESDRVSVSKVPLLGDIPLLGALFRSTNRTNQRQEVIVLLTPQILEDSLGSPFGYNYTPGADVRQMLERQRGSQQVPGNNPRNSSTNRPSR